MEQVEKRLLDQLKREFHKQKYQKEQVISESDVVVVQEDNVKRGFWKMGIVESLIHGRDGLVRGVRIRKAGSKRETLNRPISKIYPMEITCRDNEKRENRVDTERKERVKKICNDCPISTAAKDACWISRYMLHT